MSTAPYDRARPAETIAGFLAAAAIFVSLTGIMYRPLRLIPVAILLALIAIAADSNVGVDLEYIRAQSEYADIARRFFSTAEVDYLSALPSHLYAEAFFSCWTKKEAYLKACGEGLAIPLNSFSVPLTTHPMDTPVDLYVASKDQVPATRWSLYTLRPAPGYAGALAIDGTGWRLRQWQWKMPQRVE